MAIKDTLVGSLLLLKFKILSIAFTVLSEITWGLKDEDVERLARTIEICSEIKLLSWESKFKNLGILQLSTSSSCITSIELSLSTFSIRSCLWMTSYFKNCLVNSSSLVRFAIKTETGRVRSFYICFWVDVWNLVRDSESFSFWSCSNIFLKISFLSSSSKIFTSWNTLLFQGSKLKAASSWRKLIFN